MSMVLFLLLVGPHPHPLPLDRSRTRRSRRPQALYVLYSALIRTYSALRSHVHICDVPDPPVPRSTVTTRSLPFRYSAASGARSSCGMPLLKSSTGPMRTTAPSRTNSEPERPATATSRPQ